MHSVPLESGICEGLAILAQKSHGRTRREKDDPRASNKHTFLRIKPYVTQFFLLNYLNSQELWAVVPAIWIHLNMLQSSYVFQFLVQLV